MLRRHHKNKNGPTANRSWVNDLTPTESEKLSEQLMTALLRANQPPAAATLQRSNRSRAGAASIKNALVAMEWAATKIPGPPKRRRVG